MSNKARFRVGGNGSAVLPVTGGTDVFTTKPLKEGFGRVYFSLAFFSDAALSVPATPTTGDVVFTLHDDGVDFKVSGGSFPAANIVNVVQPSAVGEFDGATLTLTGVDAGLYAKAWVVEQEKSQ